MNPKESFRTRSDDASGVSPNPVCPPASHLECHNASPTTLVKFRGTISRITGA